MSSDAASSSRAVLASGGLRPAQLVLGLVSLVVAILIGLSFGPADLAPTQIAIELLSKLPLAHIHSNLSPLDAAIILQYRLPRVVLGCLVGSMLAVAGACYQGAFQNPLADPYLLGVASGAGLGATVAIVLIPHFSGINNQLLPISAFLGALGAVAATYVLGSSGRGRRGAGHLLLSGIAVAAFFTAIQTFLQQRDTTTLQQVYAWILGGLSGADWLQVEIIAPYIALTCLVLFASRRLLDVMSVGDEEADSLGVRASTVRLVIVIAATLGTAAAVSVSGLIGFVGIIVPHAVRLFVGPSYRQIVPLSLVFGGAFLVLADLLARTLLSPSEIPIGVVTAFVGAPFFLLVLHRTKSLS